MIFESWSVRKKVLAFGFSLLAGGSAILGFYLVSTQTQVRLQEKARAAAEVYQSLQALQGDYRAMGMAMAAYISEPVAENWAEKEKADKAAKEHFQRFEKASFSPEMKPFTDELRGLDENTLDPLDQKIKQMLTTASHSDVLKYYAREYRPVFAMVEALLNNAQMQAENDMEVISGEQYDVARRGELFMSLFIIVGTAFGFVLSWQMGRVIALPLEAAIKQLNAEAAQTRQAAAAISSASHDLAQSTTEQAAALQETAASVEEMSAMINKSADNAQKSGQASEGSSQVATRGKEASQQMIHAIRDINHSNSEIMKQIEDSNQKITEITKVIAEIGNKTKVINDIVFQTKLLSFNASVEAARAGEHGKGFAVVAEEVGNLAQMSGNAAKEISAMLQGSIEKVEGIVTETKTKVERLIGDGRSKVEAGTKIAEQSGHVLDEIVEQVGKVNAMVGEIATASQEQSQGVGEITKAMSQLDQVTHQNSTVSQQVATSATALTTQAESLQKVVSSLEAVVWGRGGRAAESRPEKQAKQPPVKATGKVPSKANRPAPAPAREPKVEPKREPKAETLAARLPDNVVPLRSAAPAARPAAQATGASTGVIAAEGLPSESDPRFKEV